MDLEETKKIIESEIEAEALTRNVRRQIKSYIDQKQNLREGFKETFKPLIESQEAVKTSIDTQQNKLIEQLQKNQKALTEGLDKNRLAMQITTKVLLQENNYWEHLLKSIVKFHLTDIPSLKNFKTNFFQT